MPHTYHVATTGADTHDGSEARPFATLAQAVTAARQAPAGKPRRICVAGGAYFDTHLTLTAADNGLTIETQPGANPVFYGGRPVSGWRPEGTFWVAHLPGVKERTWDFRSLLVNGRYAPRARFPETGAIRHESVFDVNWMSTTKGGWERKPTDAELTTLRFRPDSLPATLDPANAELTLYHSWDESLVGVASLNRAAGVIRFSTPAGHPPGAFAGWKEQARTFVVWNTAEGMTRPGQWYLDRTGGRIVYWPLPDERLDALQVIAPTQTSIVDFAGTAEAPVRDVTLHALAFAVTTTPMKAGGFGATAFAGALDGRHVTGLHLDRLLIFGAGGWAVHLEHTVGLHCHRAEIRDTGAGGLGLSGQNGEVTDTLIHDVGLTYPSAIALRCHGTDWRLAHNEIHHTPYSAITAGGENIRAEHNLFHHIMQELVDGAAIYMFAAKHCLIRGNHTHSVREEQVHAYYLDEQSEDSAVEGNLAVGVPWPLHMHMASRCTIRHNVCISPGRLTVSLMNCDAFVVEGNVLAAGTELVLQSSYTGIAELRRNLLWSPDGRVRWEWHDRLPSLERNAGPVPLLPRHEQTLIADPQLTCSPAGDVTFAPGSPAVALGLAPLSVHQAGRRSPPM